jgi:hypothetical protein
MECGAAGRVGTYSNPPLRGRPLKVGRSIPTTPYILLYLREGAFEQEHAEVAEVGARGGWVAEFAGGGEGNCILVWIAHRFLGAQRVYETWPISRSITVHNRLFLCFGFAEKSSCRKGTGLDVYRRR